VLQELAELEIHSIEQPIKKSKVKNQKPEDSLMAKLCAETPTPIALDEELIGIIDYEEKKTFRNYKTSIHYFKTCISWWFFWLDEWISIAENLESTGGLPPL
jgi:hypothetical protein